MLFDIFSAGSYFTAGALGLPWQTQCNEAMPWKGKHDLISHVYLQHFGHDQGDVQTLVLGLILSFFKLLLHHHETRNILFHDFGT